MVDGMSWIVTAWVYAAGLLAFRELVADVEPRWWFWRPALCIAFWPVTVTMWVLNIPIPKFLHTPKDTPR